VAKVLIVSDARTVFDELRSVLDDGSTEITEITSPEDVRARLSADPPDLLITDCQVQNMGGIAICHDVKLEESGGRLPHVPVLVLVDRRADVFLAKRSGAEGFLVKPLDPIRLAKAIEALLEGSTFHDKSFAPAPLGAPH
jgi:DNA-binding NarL/FixJ family response regulator